jgi:hypothetical protein
MLSASLPAVPQPYPNISIAELAFDGTPLDSTTTQLLQQSVSFVVTGTGNAGAIAALAPSTPQLIYTNLSSLYQSTLTSWLTYAYKNGMNPEDPFYHVTKPTPFSGNSPSSQPVTWFWGVYSSAGAAWTNLTNQAHGSGGTVAFPPPGSALAIGYPNPFNEIDVNLAAAAGPGWSYTVQYPTAVDSSGNPTAWGTLSLVTDTTAGLTQSGQLTFDPPPGWVPATVAGSPRLYYLRILAAGSGAAPVANTVLGADFVGAGGGTSGVIPAFDYSADTNHDGYLSAAEWANRKPGYNARFLWQTRLFAPGYGQMRYATDPANTSFQSWAIWYEQALLAANPQAAGLFMDNSSAIAPAALGTEESRATYSSDYAGLVQAVDQAIAPHWILANTAGGGNSADAVIQGVQGAFEENLLRPLGDTYQTFQGLASQVAHWEGLTTPPRYLVLDSMPAGGWSGDPRTQLATLAEYYLVATPGTTFLDFYGGSAPATSWSQHWSPAAAYNIGQPTGTWSVLSTGQDPSNPARTYTVLQRSYSNALVLYKPLSYGTNDGPGTIGSASATTLSLGGTYYALQANGTLGAPVTSISLINGQGAILVKASAVGATSFVISGLPTSAKAGQPVTVTVTALDPFGNVATGYTGTIHFSSSDGQAFLPYDFTFTAANQGVQTFSLVLQTPGAQTLTVTETSRSTATGKASLTVTS